MLKIHLHDAHVNYYSKTPFLWSVSVLSIFFGFQEGCVKLIKNDSKDIYNVTKDFYEINAVLSIYQIIQKKSKNCFHKNI